MIAVDLKMKTLFFDTAHVKRCLGSAKSKAMSKGLAFIRQRAASSMRKRKKSSAAGDFPCSGRF